MPFFLSYLVQLIFLEIILILRSVERFHWALGRAPLTEFIQVFMHVEKTQKIEKDLS